MNMKLCKIIKNTPFGRFFCYNNYHGFKIGFVIKREYKKNGVDFVDKKKMNIRYGLFALILIVLDQVSKLVVANTLEYGKSVPVLGEFFQLTYVHNTGAAWSMLEGKMGFFYVISIAALIVLGVFYARTDSHEKYTKLGLVMMMAGTIGNFIDRLRLKYVVDFLDFLIFGYDFPVFNIADTVLCIGVALILLDVFLESRGVKR